MSALDWLNLVIVPAVPLDRSTGCQLRPLRKWRLDNWHVEMVWLWLEALDQRKSLMTWGRRPRTGAHHREHASTQEYNLLTSKWRITWDNCPSKDHLVINRLNELQRSEYSDTQGLMVIRVILFTVFNLTSTLWELILRPRFRTRRTTVTIHFFHDRSEP